MDLFEKEEGRRGVIRHTQIPVLQRHEVFDGGAVDLFGPTPVEVGQWLEATDVGVAHAALEAAAAPLVGLPTKPLCDAARGLGLGHHLGPMGQQSVQSKVL